MPHFAAISAVTSMVCLALHLILSQESDNCPTAVSSLMLHILPYFNECTCINLQVVQVVHVHRSTPAHDQGCCYDVYLSYAREQGPYTCSRLGNFSACTDCKLSLEISNLRLILHTE